MQAQILQVARLLKTNSRPKFREMFWKFGKCTGRALSPSFSLNSIPVFKYSLQPWMFSKFWKFQEITSVVQFFLEAGANCFSTEEKLKAAIWKRWGKSTSAIKKRTPLFHYVLHVLSNANKMEINRFQKVLKSVASIVTYRFCHATDAINLKWLPIAERINYYQLKLARKTIYEKKLVQITWS